MKVSREIIFFIIFVFLMDSRTLWLTANNNTPYTWMWLDLHEGPVVMEVPPRVLGMYNDAWVRYLEDIGFLGPDKGQGGKYLVLPPGYGDKIPEGYFVVNSPNYGIGLGYRHFAVNGDFKPAMENLKKTAGVYLLSLADKPPANDFVNISGKVFSTIAPGDSQFWEYLNEVVQVEPTESFDRVSLGYFASIGIEKGKPYAPDARMQKILADAAAVGYATAQAVTYRMRHKENYFYENSAWRRLFLGGYKFEAQPDVLNLDGSIYFYFLAVGTRPAEEIEIVDKGSQYAIAYVDSAGDPMDVSSLGGLVSVPFQALYCAPKFAVEAYTEALRMEVRPFGIRVAMIEPGDFATRFTANRRVTAASGAASPYAERCRSAVRRMDQDEAGNADIGPVVRAAITAIEADEPRLRYPVASALHRTLVALRPLLPHALFERLMIEHYGLR